MKKQIDKQKIKETVPGKMPEMSSPQDHLTRPSSQPAKDGNAGHRDIAQTSSSISHTSGMVDTHMWPSFVHVTC